MLRLSAIKIPLFYALSIGFILLNLWFVVQKDSMLINALPVVLLIVLLALFSFDKIVYLVVLMAPLSIRLGEIMPGVGFDMYLPTEPLLFGLLIIFLLKITYQRGFNKDIVRHPVSIAIFINLGWILIASLASTMPVVSFKFLLARIWFLTGLFFLPALIFQKGKHMELYIWLYAISLCIVVFYATFRHMGYGLWDRQAAHYVVSPFYKDHTSYGAATAMLLPFLSYFAFSKRYAGTQKFVAFVVFGVILLGFILSYSRAAWMSMVVALAVWAMVKLKIRFQPVFITFLTLLGLFFIFQTQILMKLEQNSEQSSADMLTHISSASNITTDASNLERLNRWSCAIRMFADKPVTGFGPGTYMFKYAPYQLSKDRTIISTNAGDGGNAHSEYLGPLAESGFLGLLTYLLIIGVVIYTAVRTYTRLKDKRLRALVLASLISLVTYYIHGFLNNFLDTDKISVPFWGFTAMIVAMDIYSKKYQDPEENEQEPLTSNT